MAVARIHGKVKCRPFKERRRRAPLTKHGIIGDGLFVSCFLPLLNIHFCFSKVLQFRRGQERGAVCQSSPVFCSRSFHLEIGCNGWQYSKAQTCLSEPYEQ